MSDSITAGEPRICSYCSSRNKAGHRYCVRCSAPLQAAGSAAPPMMPAPRPASSRAMRYVLAAATVALVAAGFMVRTVVRATHEVPVLSEDVHADSTGVAAAPPPAVTGWSPGANVPAEPAPATAWSSGSFPVARDNPYDVPGDPGASMVGIAPRAPRDRAAVSRKRAFTDDDLLEMRSRPN